MLRLPARFLAIKKDVENHDPKHLYLFNPDLDKLQEWAGLLGGPGLKVLDIGSGAGVWPWVLKKAHGHSVTVTNAPVDRNLEVLYRKANKALGFECQDFWVARRARMSAPSAEYDAVTCLRAAFYTGWKKTDWEFFITDALSLLRPGGCLFLWLNRGGAAAEPFKELKKLNLEGWLAQDVLLIRRLS